MGGLRRGSRKQRYFQLEPKKGAEEKAVLSASKSCSSEAFLTSTQLKPPATSIPEEQKPSSDLHKVPGVTYDAQTRR